VFSSTNAILAEVVGNRSITSIPTSEIGEKMTEFFSFLKVLVLCLAGLIALLVLLIVLVNYLPRSPLRDVLGAVTKRLGATAAVTLIAIPVQPIVGIDGIYDVVSSVLLLCYWLLLVNDIRKALS
jgi:hypothetical protein